MELKEDCPCNQDGEGLIDILKDIKAKYDAGDIPAFNGPFGAYMRKGAPPRVREWMKRPALITRIIVARKPIFSILQKLVDYIPKWLKGGEVYDKAFHLFLVIYLSDGTVWRLEKNEVLNLVGPLSKTAEKQLTNFGNPYNSDQVGAKIKDIESRVFSNLNQVTPAQFIEDGLKAVGPTALFVYDPRTTNCQHFVLTLLSANGTVSEDLKKFIMQDAKSILDRFGVLGGIGKIITDGAAAADTVLHGQGLQYPPVPQLIIY